MREATVQSEDKAWLPTFGAWMVALTSTLGALFIGEVMGQAPCDLCWHQRAFMFPLAILLASDGRA
ncbi:putative disulfide formation protein (fragment) [Agrobacterium genomosp. 5 str. CFBP 6626]